MMQQTAACVGAWLLQRRRGVVARVIGADLAALPQQTQDVTFESGDGPQAHTYDGPLLIDVLNLAVPSFDPDVKNDKLGHAIVVTASDGYLATVAWGEIDPDFENKPILLAISQDGEPLEGGPRLTAPGDLRGGRYVSDVVDINLLPAGVAAGGEAPAPTELPNDDTTASLQGELTVFAGA